MWEVAYTDEFGEWWTGLSIEEQSAIERSVKLLMTKGVNLGYPHSSDVYGSRHSHMRELRTQSGGKPFAPYMPLTQDARQFYSLQATKQAINAGMKHTFQLPMTCMMNI